MTAVNEKSVPFQPPPLVLARTFAAPRDVVFCAWGSAEQLKQWFCPAGFTIPEAQVEFRVGGAFNICMRSPQGTNHWTQGRYSEIAPPDRLVIYMKVAGENGEALFDAHTVVLFSDAEGGTRIEVTQSYVMYDPSAEFMIQGASTGWAQTLDRLSQLLEVRP
jgi:uncharacterized protein YndB with AHSA1/START domain